MRQGTYVELRHLLQLRMQDGGRRMKREYRQGRTYRVEVNMRDVVQDDDALEEEE